MAKKDLFEEWIEEGIVENRLAVLQSLARQGKTVAQIGANFGLSERQFLRLQKKHPPIHKAMRMGRQEVTALLENQLYAAAQEGNVTAIIYALKIYGGEFFNDRKYVQKTEVTGKDGAPLAEPKVVLYLPQKQAGADEE